MDIKEIFAKMGSGELAAHSELGTRDEAKQSKSYSARIQKLKATTGIKAHALVMKDLVIPFNPFTLEVDANYNSKTPFRPIMLVSQALDGIKSYAAQHPECATAWEKHMGVEPGTIAWAEPVTKEEYYIFKRMGYIKPRILSYSTITLRMGGVGGFSEFPQKYTVDPSELDETNNYAPEKRPIHQKMAMFFNSMLKKKWEEILDGLEKQGASKDTVAKTRAATFSESPVSFVNQTNLVPFIYCPYNAAPGTYATGNYTAVEQTIRWFGYQSDKWGTAIGEAMKDNNYDENIDYFDLTMRTPSSSDTKSNGQVYTDDDTLELYTALTITSTDSRFSIWTGKSTVDGVEKSNSELYAPMFQALRDYFAHSQEESFHEGGDTFEKIMAASNRFRPFESVADKFLSACYQIFLDKFKCSETNSKYFTEDIKRANSEILIAMNPDNALALADVDEEDLEQASKQQDSSMASLIADLQLDGGDDLSTEINGESDAVPAPANG